MSAKGVSIHTLVGHINPDLECCTGLYVLRNFKLFREAFGIKPDEKLKFIPAGTLRPEDWEAGGITDVDGTTLEAHGFLAFDCGDGGRLDQHGKMEELNGECSSLDLMVHFAGCKESPDYTRTLKHVLDLVSENDLTGTEIVGDPDVETSKWPNTRRTLRNLVTALNLSHPRCPEAVVNLVATAYTGLFAFVEAEARRVTGNPAGVLSDLPVDQAVKIARSGFFMPNIIRGLRSTGSSAFARFVHEYEAAFGLYEKAWRQAVKDYFNPDKTKVISGVQFRMPNGAARSITVVFVVSNSTRIAAVCRKGNWGKGGEVNRPYQDYPARRGADIVVNFQETNQRKFSITTAKGLQLHSVAAAIRAADVVARGVQGLKPADVQAMTAPGHLDVVHNGERFPLLYLAEFGTAFGHLRSGDMAQTVLSKVMIKELMRRVLTEGLSDDLVADILHNRVISI